MGRATNENIALHILYELRDLSVRSIRLNEEGEHWVEVFSSESDLDSCLAFLAFNKALSFLLKGAQGRAIEELEKAAGMKDDSAEAYNHHRRKLCVGKLEQSWIWEERP